MNHYSPRRPSKKKSLRSKQSRQFHFEHLEPRQMLAITTADLGIKVDTNRIVDHVLPIDQQEDLARNYLDGNAETAYLQQGDSDLQLVDVKHGLASIVTWFQQTIDGVPVYGSFVSTIQGPDGEFQQFHEAGFPELETSISMGPTPSLALAESIALSHAGATETFAETQSEIVWLANEDGTAEQVLQMTVYGLDPVGDYLTFIDLETTEVISQENLISFFENGSGDVYYPNPYQEQGSGLGLTDNNDANSFALQANLQNVTLEGLQEGTGLLIGEFVDLATLNSSTLADVDADEPTRVYNYTRDDPRFEQVNVYHTVDQLNRYFHALGFDDDTGAPNGIRDFATLANAHWDTADNSFYSTGDDAIHFGDGGVDDAEDGDIIAHEYGHAVQFNQNPAWGGGEMGAMGEGFGDYLAASFFKTSGNATFQADHAAAVGEWDATSYSSDDPPNLRRVDGDKMYPVDIVGQVHQDGEIWSRALWDINNALGGAIADQIILEAHFLISAGATMPDGAQAVLLADLNINGGANEAAIRQAFEDRGILDPLPDAGFVEFNKNSYTVSDTVVVQVTDSNATTPVMVTITSSAGDSETLTLTDIGGGAFSEMINTVEGSAVADDGVLQVGLGQTLTVTYEDDDDGQGNPNTVTDTATISNITEYPSSDTPIQFIDNETITSVITINEGGLVGDLDMNLNITHTWDADLDAFLIAPDGTRVELFQDIGGSDDNFTDTYLDDEADESITSGTAPFTGSFRPVGSFSDFDFLSITGDWTLEITDDAGGDTGTLDNWTMFIDVLPVGVGSVEFDGASYNIGDDVMVTVTDANAVGPIDVIVDVSSGDSETLTLNDNGDGTHTGMLPTAAGSASSEDGTLQVDLADVLTVTYEDQDNGTGSSATVQDTANIANVTRYDSTDVPVDIVDNETITSTIDITDEGTVADVDVLLNITHTWDADLDVFLIGADGTRVELFQDVGGSGDNFTETRLDDEADGAIGDGAAPFTGSFQPVGSLADLDTMSITGTWTLEISDDAGGDSGTLDGWSLFIDVVPPVSQPDIVVIGPAGPTSEGNAGATTVDFEIQLSNEWTEVIEVDFSTTVAGMTNPANPGSDFVEVSGTATFQPGETSVIVPVDILGDFLIENDESFGVILSNAVGATITQDIAVADIVDDERFGLDTPIDFVTDDSPILSGGLGLSNLEYNSTKKVGWEAGAVGLQFADRGAGGAFNQDIMLAESATFSADVAGLTRVRILITYGDADIAHDDMQVTVEGITYPAESTAAGEYLTRLYAVRVSDGQLNIEFNDLGGADPNVAIAGLTVKEVGRFGFISSFNPTQPSFKTGDTSDTPLYDPTGKSDDITQLMGDTSYDIIKPISFTERANYEMAVKPNVELESVNLLNDVFDEFEI